MTVIDFASKRLEQARAKEAAAEAARARGRAEVDKVEALLTQAKVDADDELLRRSFNHPLRCISHIGLNCSAMPILVHLHGPWVPKIANDSGLPEGASAISQKKTDTGTEYEISFTPVQPVESINLEFMLVSDEPQV